MKCNEAIQQIVNDSRTSKLAEHLHECSSCSIMDKKIEQQMNLLDRVVEIPDDLLARTIALKSQATISRFSPIDYHKYLQLAAVVAAGFSAGAVFLDSVPARW